MGGGAGPGLCPKCSRVIKPGDTVCRSCGTEIDEVSRTLTTDFTASPVGESWVRFAPGSVFANRYTIIEEIGFGGMGRVYKAIDNSLGIIVALKIIRPEYASNPRIIEHFKKETVLSRSISSEHVVRVHDLGESEDTKYISMDYVEGQNLRNLIRTSGSLTIPAAVRFGKQICSALSAAHNVGIIHRDLKPSNVMIDRAGQVQVMDFGLAKTVERDEPHRAGSVAGTPAYLSPEQARGENLDERTDIYSLGLILYEMVTGCPAFEADSATEYIKKHCSINPELPSRLNPSVPRALEILILKCLEKKREERYQAAEEVCRDLDLATRPPRPTRSIIVRWLVGVFACAAILLAGYLLFNRGNAPPARAMRKSLAVMSFENVTGDPSQDHFRHVFQNLLITDLGQSRYMRLVSREKLLQCLKDFGAEKAQVFASDILDRIASHENVDFFLLGSYMISRQGYRIDIRIIDGKTHESLGSHFFEVAALTEIPDRCDEISSWAKSQLGLTKGELARDSDQELKDYTSASIDALILFSRGLDFYDQGDLKNSTECYLKAIEIDEKFAMAYARLGVNSTYAGRWEEANKYIRQAMSLSENLPHRERLLIEGDYHWILEGDAPKAIPIYQNLLSLYPDDEAALEILGAIYRETEEWNDAAKCFESLQAISRTRIVAQNLSFIYQEKGQYEKAADIIRSNEAILVSSGDYHSALAFCYFCQGKLNEAFKELGEDLSQNPHGLGCLRRLGQFSLVRGHYREAEAAYRQLLEGDREDLDKLEGHFWLGHLYLVQGKYQDCNVIIQDALKLTRQQGLPFEELTFLLFESDFYRLQGDFARAYETAQAARQKAVEVRYKPDEIKALHLMGLCQVGRDDISEAQKSVSTMSRIIEKMAFPKLLRYCYHLEGRIAISRESWDEAVINFSKATELLSYQNFVFDKHALFLEALASALYRRGDLDAARAEYEKVVSLTTGLPTSGDAYARSLFQLGRIFHIKDDPERAREYLQKYLAVRAEADAGLPEVEEAQRLLASLS